MPEWERVDEEEELVEEEEEVVESDEEVVESTEEVIESDAVVVGRPRGDPVLEFILGLTNEVPGSLGEWRFPWLLTEYRKAEALGKGREASRIAELIFRFCPAKPRVCPIYSVTVSSCPYNMEKRCRPRAWAESRGRARKTRSYFRRRRR